MISFEIIKGTSTGNVGGWMGKEFCVVCNSLLVGTLRQSDLFGACNIYCIVFMEISQFNWLLETCRTCACARMMARKMTFDLLDHVIKVTFEQRTENNAILYVLLSPVKVPSIAPLTVIYIVYKLSFSVTKTREEFFVAMQWVIVVSFAFCESNG